MSSISLKFKIYINEVSVIIMLFELVRYHIEFRFCRPLMLDTSSVFKKIYEFSAPYGNSNNIYISFCLKFLENVRSPLSLNIQKNFHFVFFIFHRNFPMFLLFSQNFKLRFPCDQKLQYF